MNVLNEGFERFRLSLDVAFGAGVTSVDGKNVTMKTSVGNLSRAVFLGRHTNFVVFTVEGERMQARVDPWT